MKKIVLIQPKAPETFWQLTGVLEIVKKKAVIPPLALATIAALTPPEYEVEIIDESIEEIDFDMDCDLVGLTGFTIHSKRMFEISKKFRDRGILTVVGGPYCSSTTEEVVPHFDVVICGEAEHIWATFLSDWDKGVHSNKYVEKEYIDVALTPIPRWELVKLENYTASMLQTSRGCPYDCEFCDVIALFGQKTRFKPIKNVMAEIKNFTDRGRFEIFFSDDNFIGNKKYARELLHELIKLNKTLKKPLRFITQLTLNVAQDLEFLDLFKQANFFSFFIGIETPKEESLKITNKQHNLRFDMLDAIKKIHSKGIFIISGMIVGFDADDIDIFNDQSRFLIDAGITIPMLGMLMAPRGTKLWDRLEDEGRLLPQLSGGDMFAETNFHPKLMTKKELEDNYIKLLKEVFSDSHFLKRFEKLIDQLNLDEIKNSPLAEVMKLSNFRWYNFGVTLRLIKHYLFNPDKAKRQLFFQVMKIAFKKSRFAFPWAIEHLLYFKAENEYVFQHNIDYQKIQDNAMAPIQKVS